MSGWQRTGVIISVLWLVGLSIFFVYDAYKDSTNYADFESLMAEVGGSRSPITRKDFRDIKKAIAMLKKIEPAADHITIPDFISARAAKSILNGIASKSAVAPKPDGTVEVPFWLAR